MRRADGAGAGAEALARWLHPREGTIYPSEFVPVLERSGAVRALDLYVFERVCERLARWLREGREPVPVSVTLSRRHFEDPRFLARFADTADRLGVPRGLLEMELTESIFLDDEAIDNVKRAVRDLRAAGFSCSLDDFGSDYSSLGLLKEFDVSALKLDRRFFREDTPRARDVLGELNSLLLWGYFLVFFGPSGASAPVLEALGEQGLEALRSRDAVGFARAMDGYYRLMLAAVRTFLEAAGMPGTERLAEPAPDATALARVSAQRSNSSNGKGSAKT